MGFHMESSSSRKSDNPQTQRPGFLEKRRHMGREFRDDTFVEPPPVERRIFELKANLESNSKTLQELQNRFNTCKELTDAAKQKDDLFLWREFNSIKKALKLPNENLLDMKSVEDKLGKSRAFLDMLKTKGMTTQELEDHFYSIKQSIKTAKNIFDDYAEIEGSIRTTQSDITNIKKAYPSTSFNREEVKEEKIHPIKNQEQYDEALSKVKTHCKEIASCDQALKVLDIPTNAQEAVKLFQTRLYHEETWAKLCKAVISYELNVASSKFEAFTTKISDIKSQLDLPEQDRNGDKKSINNRIDELNKAINQDLKDLGLGPSKKNSAAKQILKARDLQSKLGEDIQKIKDENTDLINEQRRLSGISRFNLKDAIYTFEKVKEELKDIKENSGLMGKLDHLRTNHAITKDDTSTGEQVVQGGLERMKEYWATTLKSDVDAAAMRLQRNQGTSQGE